MAPANDRFPSARTELAELYSDLDYLAVQPASPRRPRRERSGRRRRFRVVPSMRLLMVLLGVGLIGTGLWVIASPILGTWQRGQADSRALTEWRQGGAQALVGGVGTSGGSHPDFGDRIGDCAANQAPPDAYALMAFPTLTKYGYSGVAGDGTWDLLKDRSVVHYQGTAAPGQQGNVIIAFHREPNYEHIDELGKGDTIDLQDRSCRTYHYKVTEKWVLDPEKVTQLVSTDGHDLTLITCTPWWRDTQRIVWRATLVTGA
jgi:LPXTG-site transpeptidase (sortase) family protein